MLQMNVSQQIREPIGSTREYNVNDNVNIAGADSQVEGKVTFTHTDRGILVTGILQTEVELTCSRCLSPCLYPLPLKITEEYFPTIDVMTGSMKSVPDEPGCFTIDEHHVIDLTEAIVQYTTMAIPMKPLCRMDCAGLCPTCGHNLNLGKCDCPPTDIDPRWAALKKLTSSGNNDR